MEGYTKFCKILDGMDSPDTESTEISVAINTYKKSLDTVFPRASFLCLISLLCHAVLLLSGFVGLRLEPVKLFSTAFTISSRYALPGVVANGSESDVKNNVLLKFQSMGHFVLVYGSLSDGSSQVHRICLDASIYAPALRLMHAMSESEGSTNTNNMHDYPETQVFQLWKLLKDGLALPLLIDLCEKSGLDPPPCFKRLPTDVKLKILTHLPGVDIAKMACVSKELKCLSLDNTLWKNKFVEEITERSTGTCSIRLPLDLKLMIAEYIPPSVDISRMGCLCSEFKHFSCKNDFWKQKIAEDIAEESGGKRVNCFKEFFALHWAGNNSRRAPPFAARVFRHLPDIGVYNPFHTPAIMGGIYDLVPGFGGASSKRLSFPFPFTD